MKRILVFVLTFFMLPPLAFAVVVEHELGYGLVYLRLHQLPDDLPPKPAGRVSPCVVDVRYVDADAAAATAFSAWLKLRAMPRTPVFVLANVDTSAALLKVLAARERSAGIVIVGIEGAGFRPDVTVKASTADERSAYDALEKGTPVASLLSDNPSKVRNDEASLSKPLAEASANTAEEATTAKRTPLPIDAALQRAVHLHRTLVALKRI